MIRGSIGLLALFGLAACGGHSPIQKVEPTPLTDYTAEREINSLWSQGTGSGTKDFLRLTPALSGKFVYVADTAGRVTAIESESGRERWSVHFDLTTTGATAAGEGIVVIADRLGQVVAIDQADGKERWRARVTSQVLAPALISGGTVVIQSQDGRLHGLDAKDGKSRWIYTTTVPALSLRGTGRPVGFRDAVLSGFASGRVVAVNAKDGRLVWEQAVSNPRGRNEIERLVDVDAPVHLVAGTLVAASYQGRVIAVSLRTGSLLWAREVSTYSGIDSDSRNLFLTDEDGTVIALGQGSGATVWKQDKLRGRHLSAPVYVDGMVVVGDFEGYVHWLSAEDGHLLARYQVGADPILAPAVVDADRIYVLTKGGELAALRATRKN